jgi:hypothetical protein
MPDNPAAAFLRRVRTEPEIWPHAAIVEHLMRVDPLWLGTITSRALLGAGVLVPTEAARRRVAERIAAAVVRDEAIPDDVVSWLHELALDAADSLRLDGVDALDEGERVSFLGRLASCLGVDDGRARAALEALQALSPEHVAALRGFLPASFTQVALHGVSLPFDAALAVEAIRQVIRGVRSQQ